MYKALVKSTSETVNGSSGVSLFFGRRYGSGCCTLSYNRLASDAVIDRFLDMLASSRNPVSQTYEIQCEIRASI